MNKLYQIMYPGAYLPWGIVLMYYAFHLDLFHFISALNYALLAGAKLTHMEHLGRPVLYWSRMFTMSEFSLIVRLIVFMETRSSVLSVVGMLLAWFILSRLPERQQATLIQAPLYCVCVLTLVAITSSWTHRACGLALACSSLYQHRCQWEFESYETMERKVSDYFRLKIADAYLIFLLEWSSSSLHWASLGVVAALSCAFQLYAYSEVATDPTSSNLSDFYHNIHRLPSGYPIPLNFMTSREHCKVAKRVFKPHFI